MPDVLHQPCVQRVGHGFTETLTYEDWASSAIQEDTAAREIAEKILDDDEPYPYNDDEPWAYETFEVTDRFAFVAQLYLADPEAARDRLRELEGEGEFREIPAGSVAALSNQQVALRIAELDDNERGHTARAACETGPCPQAAPAAIWVAVIEREAGPSVYAGTTFAAALARVAVYCRENWGAATNSSNSVPTDSPPADQDAVALYFSVVEGEEYLIANPPLTGAAATGEAAPAPARQPAHQRRLVLIEVFGDQGFSGAEDLERLLARGLQDPSMRVLADVYRPVDGPTLPRQAHEHGFSGPDEAGQPPR
jgi:hypothetical protein